MSKKLRVFSKVQKYDIKKMSEKIEFVDNRLIK